MCDCVVEVSRTDQDVPASSEERRRKTGRLRGSSSGKIKKRHKMKKKIV